VGTIRKDLATSPMEICRNLRAREPAAGYVIDLDIWYMFSFSCRSLLEWHVFIHAICIAAVFLIEYFMLYE